MERSCQTSAPEVSWRAGRAASEPWACRGQRSARSPRPIAAPRAGEEGAWLSRPGVGSAPGRLVREGSPDCRSSTGYPGKVWSLDAVGQPRLRCHAASKPPCWLGFMEDIEARLIAGLRWHWLPNMATSPLWKVGIALLGNPPF